MGDADTDLRLEIARQLFHDMPKGFPYENFELEDLILPDGDDMGIPSEDDEIDEEEVETDTGFGNVIVLDNIPKVPEEKVEKLQGVIRKLCSGYGSIREGGLYMPWDDSTKTSKGFCFVEFETAQEAAAAREGLNDYRLDKNHLFKANLFDDFDKKYAKVPEEYMPYEDKPYQVVENLNSWMLDKLGRDQFAVRHGDETTIFWNDGKRNRAELVYNRAHWTESFIQWSPLGNYLATVHRQGVAIWGGPSFSRIARFEHTGVQFMEISPNEKYLITCSLQDVPGTRETTVLINIFDMATKKKLRYFTGPVEEFAVGANGTFKWPVFKWAGGRDDLYFAKLTKNAIQVYSCPDMRLLDNKPFRVDGLVDFEWSPAEPIIAAYCAEQGNMPAKVVLYRIPEKTEIKQKTIFNVAETKLFWHPQGDYLAVQVMRFTKTKKSTYPSFELFNLRAKDTPLEVLDIAGKGGQPTTEKVMAFAWEPKGHRFALVHGENNRPSITFYSMKDQKGRDKCTQLGSYANKSCTNVYWSPQGRNIVIAGLKTPTSGLNGQLEFFNVDEMETTATAEHFMCTDVLWDPTGRYVATAAMAASGLENSFYLWSFSGKMLYQQPKDRLVQFAWRPRLPSLLPPEKEAEILKNLKQYSKRYDEEDEQLLMQADQDVQSERQQKQDQWNDFVEKRRQYVQLQREFAQSVYGEQFAEREYELIQTTVEQTLDVKEEPYNPK